MNELPLSTYLITTDPGLEPLLIEEWEALCTQASIPIHEIQARAFQRRGLVELKVSATQAQVANLFPSLRAAHHVMQHVHHFYLPDQTDLTPLADCLEKLDVSAELSKAQSFRITTKRVGSHGFNSYDVASMAGRIIQQRYGLPVDLERYSHDLRVDVYDKLVWIGWHLTRQGLSRRFEDRPYYRTVSLRPNLAYALLKWANIPPHHHGRLLDPFCGAGTILMEAASLFPELILMGSDRYAEPIEGAQANLSHYGLDNRVQVQQIDMHDLSTQHEAGSLDFLVTNPPFGLRMAQRVDLRRFYASFLEQAAYLLAPTGTLTLLMLKAASFRQAVAKSPLRVMDVHRVEIGGKEMRVYHIGHRSTRSQANPIN